MGSDGQGKIGVRLAPNGEETRLKADNFGQAFSLGAGEFQRLTLLTVQGFQLAGTQRGFGGNISVERESCSLEVLVEVVHPPGRGVRFQEEPGATFCLRVLSVALLEPTES